MFRIKLPVLLLLLAVAATGAEPWKPLFNGKDLEGWEKRGECIWTVLPDGVLLGQRAHPKPEAPFREGFPVSEKQYRNWFYRHAWLYSKAEYGEYDLSLEYIVPPGVNSGISIRDRSRAHTPIGESDAERPDLAGFPKTTPAHIGYEIQIIDADETMPSGSIYSLVPAKSGVQKAGEWNTLVIESRNEAIRVRINGQLVAESPGVAGRSKTGPIGIQLHDQFSSLLLRNIRIREMGGER